MDTRPRYRVPDELRETLLDFTIAYLLERPANLPAFGIGFFNKLIEQQGQRAGSGSGAGIKKNSNNGTTTGTSGGGAGNQEQQHATTTDENEDDTTQVTGPPLRSVTRRKSVFAETYNPEDDDDDDLNLIVHPKSDEQRIRLAEAVKNILLFRSLDAEQMQQVLDAMFERKVINNEFVITQGEDGDNFYIIESGIYPVYVSPEDPPKLPTTNTKPVFTYMNSGSFGELALMYNMPRAATVQAQGNNCSLWAMDRTTFRKIILKSAFKKRQMYESLLEQVPMLKGLENYERLNLADALVPRSYSSSDIIIRQGDVADGMYFVEDGTVRITRLDSNGEEKELTRCSKGGYFGELALLTSSPRAATVEAIGNVKLAFLDVDAFERLLGPCMELMKRNAEDYEKQLLLLFGSTSNITHMR